MSLQTHQAVVGPVAQAAGWGEGPLLHLVAKPLQYTVHFGCVMRPWIEVDFHLAEFVQANLKEQG